jgi:hypothetical protein
MSEEILKVMSEIDINIEEIKKKDTTINNAKVLVKLNDIKNDLIRLNKAVKVTTLAPEKIMEDE